MAVDFKRIADKLYIALGVTIEELNKVQDCNLVEEHEGILLAAGDKDITFKTDFKPTEVFVSVTSEGLPVCVGDRNAASVTLLDDGFILHTEIRTDHAMVKWIIKKD